MPIKQEAKFLQTFIKVYVVQPYSSTDSTIYKSDIY